MLANHQSPDQSDATVLRIVLSLVALHDQYKEAGGLKVTRDMTSDHLYSFEVNTCVHKGSYRAPHFSISYSSLNHRLGFGYVCIAAA